MRIWLKLVLAAISFVTMNACTYSYVEDVARNKTAIVTRNLMAFSSETPTDFKISYYVADGGTSNKLETTTLRTPCVLDMGKVVLKYDSVVRKLHVTFGKDKVKDHYKQITLTTLFGEYGAGYFKLDNLSKQTIKFAIVGVQKLETYRDGGREMIDSHPNPIYKGVPLLYLLKPEQAPSKDLYFATLKYQTRKGGLSSSLDGDPKGILLYPDRLGSFTSSELPFSAEKIVSLYANESQHLYLSYSNYSLELVGYENENERFRGLKDKNIRLFREVKPLEVVYNRGTYPLLPIGFGNYLQEENGREILVSEQW